MSNIEDKPAFTRTIQFRVTEDLATALNSVAAQGLYSVSDVVRTALVKDMRERGLYKK